MPEFERSKERKGRSNSKENDRGSSFEDFTKTKKDRRRGPGRRDSGREFGGRRDSGRSRGSRDVEMTKVTCSSCGVECEVPFKPTSSKPVYCSECFRKDKPGSDRPSSGISDKDLDQINEKLNKIMKALKIE